MTEQTPLTQDQVRFALVREAGWTEAEADEALAEIEAAAARRALEGSGVVEALEGLVEAIVTAPLVEVEDETTITLCVPLAAIKPAYWAACAAIGHQPTDPGPYCARCGATITAVVQSAEHHPGDCAAVEEAGSSPARGDALPRPEEPRVERCAVCGVGRWVIAHDPEAGPTYHPFTPEAR